jgi:Yip1 domain
VQAVNIFVSPAEAYAPVAREASFRNAFLAYAAGYVVVSWLMREPSMAVMLSTLPPEVPRSQVSVPTPPGMALITAAGAVAASGARVLVLAGMLWSLLLLLDLSGRKSPEFRKVLGVVVLASFVLLVRDLVNAVVLHARGMDAITGLRDLYPNFSVATLVPDELGFAAFRALNALDPFFAWYAALVYLGLRGALSVRPGTAAAVTAGFAIATVAGVYGLALLQPAVPGR